MLQTLELTNFRSYDSGLFGFEPGVNIIVGPNASGKTNLLQAIHTIATSGGFGSSDKELISIAAQWSRLEALTDNGVRVVKLSRDKLKAIELDGVLKRRLNAQTALPVVVFEPTDMLMLSNEPERRRAFLDSMLNFTYPGYKTALLEYKRTLAQRNKLLKQDPSSISGSLFVWDVQLSQRAGIIASARAEITETLASMCPETYQRISSSNQSLELSYQSKLPIGNYSDRMLSYLREHADIDKMRGFTTIGPHRDDLLVELKGSDARITASRGETRSIILTLKIAQLHLLHKQTGRSPILLLDDVFSELDGSRRRNLAEALSNYQTFLTTTDADVAVDHFSNYNIIPMS